MCAHDFKVTTGVTIRDESFETPKFFGTCTLGFLPTQTVHPLNTKVTPQEAGLYIFMSNKKVRLVKGDADVFLFVI